MDIAGKQECQCNSESVTAKDRRVFATISRPVLTLLLALLLGLGSTHRASAQRAMPDSAPLTNFNPLCDSSLVHCLEIDDFAGHLYGHLQVLPKSERRDTAAVFPFGVTLGLFGRFAGGVSTYYSFWNEGDALYQQLGPLRLSLTGRLLPIFPLWSSGGSAEGAESGDSHYAPPRGFRLGLAYEHELRIGPFSGANSLGLLTDLASLYLVGSKMLGPFQLSASIGALYDWRGSFATGSIAAQLGLFLPGFKALKIFVEGMGRGFPAYVKKGALLPTLGGQDSIRPQGMAGGGLAFHPHARIDLSVAVQRGFGGIAPWVVSVNFLVVSIGKTYEGRAATPMAQLAADVTREFVSWTVEKLQTIDPYLKHDCILYDDNHQPTGKLGELSPDGDACIYQGLRVPIGPRFWHNHGDTQLCYDKKLKDCFLIRSEPHSAWAPIHPLLVQSDCFAYYNGQPWMRVGKPTSDKQACENHGHVIPVGQALKPDHSHPTYYCYDEPDKEKNQTKKLWCLERPSQPQTAGQYIDRRLAVGIDRAKESLDRTGDRVRQAIDESAGGVPLHATTPVQEAADAGREALDRIKNVTDEDAKRAFFGVLRGAKDWLKKPLREQAGDVAEEGGDILASPSTYIPGGTLLGREGRIAAEGVEAAAEATHAGKRSAQVVKAAEHAEQAVADATKAEKKAAQASRAAAEASVSDVAPELGKKLDYFLGRATGNSHNVDRSRQMLGQLERIGLPDTPATRQQLAEHLTGVLHDPSNIAHTQVNGRIVRESLLTGPRGVVKFETVWDGNRLITGNIFGGQ